MFMDPPMTMAVVFGSLFLLHLCHRCRWAVLIYKGGNVQLCWNYGSLKQSDSTKTKIIHQTSGRRSGVHIPKLKLIKNTSIFLHQCTFIMHRRNRTSDKLIVKPVHKGRWLYLLVTHSIVFKALKESLS